MTDTPTGRYFEDFPVGEALVSGRRTITEADVAAFAGLSGGDPAPSRPDRT